MRRPLLAWAGPIAPFTVMLATALLCALWPTLAYAHANLVRSSPAANAILAESPKELRLTLSEPPELRLSDVRVLDRAGQRTTAPGQPRLETGAGAMLVVPLQPLADGIYTVLWRVTSTVDGHVSQGSLVFAVGAETVTPGELQSMFGDFSSTGAGTDPPLVVSQWLNFLATTLLVGGIVFYPAVLGPASREPWPGARLGAQATLAAAPAATLALPFAPLYLAWGLGVLALLASAVFQAAASAGTDLGAALGLPLSNLVRGTRYGTLLWLRLVVLVAIGGWLAVGQGQAQGGRLEKWWQAVALSLCGLLLLIVAQGSHGAGAQKPPLSLWAEWLHLGAVSVWGGGLLMLALVLPRVRRLASERPLLPARVVASFSRLGLASVAVIIATGAYRAAHEVADLNNLVDTAYGWVMLGKHGLMAPLLALAAVNLLVLRGRSQRPGGTAALRRTVVAEFALLALILGATSLLGGLPPARDAFGAGLLWRGEQGGVHAIIAVNPGELGPNTFEVYLSDAWRRPIGDAAKVALILYPPERELGPTEVVAQAGTAGRYAAEGSYLSLPGEWETELLVRLPGRADLRYRLSLTPDTAGD
ncbi:MAG: copper resistance CopC/CopD family protein [Chloroflexota bacterium]